MSKRGAILIAGPTASGKSALAIRLARDLSGVVVNADSMQVYRDLRILTARPSPEDEAAAPHRLFGHVDGAVNYSVGHWLKDVAGLLPDLDRSGLVPIFVGGTGLYFKALTQGLSEIPPVPDSIRAELRAAHAGWPTPELHAALARQDPLTAIRLKPHDRLRIERALEVFAATGRSVTEFQGLRKPGLLAGLELVRVILASDRTLLRERIDRRFERMIAAGALDEVARLAERDLDPALPVMRAHGVPALVAHRRGEIDLAQAIARGQADTRAYAKRQSTWARTQMSDWTIVVPAGAAEAVERLIHQAEKGSGISNESA